MHLSYSQTLSALLHRAAAAWPQSVLVGAVKGGLLRKTGLWNILFIRQRRCAGGFSLRGSDSGTGGQAAGGPRSLNPPISNRGRFHRVSWPYCCSSTD